jgi:uncharacterized membrane protein YphA (DoxX/SURF4 family)
MVALFGEPVGGGVRYVLLVVLGLVGLDAVAHGLFKLVQGPATLGGGIIGGLGLPFPTFFGALVMGVELIGGILLLVVLVREATLPPPSRRPSRSGR